MQIFSGTGGTSGIVIGKAYNIYSSFQSVPRHYLHKDETAELHIQRLNAAKQMALNEISESESKSTQFLGEELHKMFETHRMILNDPQILPKVIQQIQTRKINAEWALTAEIERIRSEFEKIQNNYIKSRFNDIRQVLERLMDFLTEKNDKDEFTFSEPVILIKSDFSPTEITGLITKNVIGIATEYGGEKSHTAIMCQSLGIPLVVGLENILGKVQDFETVILDTEKKRLIVEPTPEQFEQSNYRIRYLAERVRRLRTDIDRPCRLKDGDQVMVEANIDFPTETNKVVEYNMDGIGLLRTEILFMTREQPPSSDEQYELLKQIVGVVGDKPVTVRTWDLGADKSAQFFPALHNEVNPALGLRAIRICLREQEFFKTQLRALIRLSNEHNVRILLPMITGIGEITYTRQLVKELCDEMQIPEASVSLGSMIETPAAAVNVEEILRYSDFISIGSNDLVQYMLGIDRGNEYVSHLYSAYHPSIIHILSKIIRSANFIGKEIVVCGEISADPVMQLIMLGMGDVILSMNTEMALITRKFLSYFTRRECQKIAFRFLSLRNREECKELHYELREKFKKEISDKM